jgi:glutamyl-tRNA reductase
MNLISVSINHRTAPLELREALHLNVEEIKEFLKELKGTLFNEGFILSTCNRTEISGFPKEPKTNFKDIQKFLIDRKPISSLTPENFQNFFSCGAVNHIFKIAGGIDSQLIGDNQILGQVKEAFQLSEDFNFAGFFLRRIFDSTIRVGKRAKTETEISDGAITISYAAVQLIEKIFSYLNKKSALVIGTGETGELAAKYLKEKGIRSLAVTNRTLPKAEKLAGEIQAKIIPFQFFKEYLKDYDIIISATSSNDFMLSYDDVKTAMKLRNNSSMILMDIAVPRDIDPKVKTIENLFYHDIDSLKIIVDQNLEKRQSEIPKVNQIVREELVKFFSWYNSLEVTPTIVSLRQYFEDIRTEEIEKIKNKIDTGEIEKVEMLTKRIVNKLLHQPTTELKKLSENGTDINDNAVIISAIRSLFGLNGNKEGRK